MTLNKIRDAATLIITCAVKNNALNAPDYKIMLLKRSKNMKFAAHFIVFPGGAHDKSDESLDWLKIIPKNSNQLCLTTSNPHLSRPDRFKVPYNPKTTLSPELSFRICALRETFEETGLLIAHRKDNSIQEVKSFANNFGNSQNLMNWRERVKEKPAEFLNMFNDLKLVPDLLSLHEWSNWLGPEIEPKRFDTMFFTCFLNEIPFNIQVDKDEIANVEFLTPEETLEKYNANEIELKPPQIFELLRLKRWKKINELANYSKERQFLGGTTTWLPKFITNDNTKRIGLLPGKKIFKQC
jgi:nucleoside diphosphate-linked moiety X motif 19, mitochondrial